MLNGLTVAGMPGCQLTAFGLDDSDDRAAALVTVLFTQTGIVHIAGKAKGSALKDRDAWIKRFDTMARSLARTRKK